MSDRSIDYSEFEEHAAPMRALPNWRGSCG